MSRSRWLSWGGVVALSVALGACGGGEAEHEDEREEGGGVSGPSATVVAPTPSPTATGTPAPAGGTTAAAVAWDQDIQPILASDCVRCHGYLSSYAGTMSVVSPGNPNSTLVTVTRSGGSMYSHLSGDRTAKAALIRAWVVDNNAAPSR